MSQVINTNIMSLNAQRNLQNSSASLSTTIQRLSSGLRINSAKDDAAGLAISERFTTQIRGMDQAARNANDGISLAQTAEGALGEVANNLQRIRELAVQARNATNSASDRAALNAEVQLLKAEIQRVAEQTNFNGTALLDGSFQNQAFQIGADQGQVINIAQIANANIDSLGNWNKAPTASQMTAVAAVSSGGSAVVNSGALPVENVGGGPIAGTGTKTTVTIDATSLLANYSTPGSLAFSVGGVAQTPIALTGGANTLGYTAQIDAITNALSAVAPGFVVTGDSTSGQITLTAQNEGATTAPAIVFTGVTGGVPNPTVMPTPAVVNGLPPTVDPGTPTYGELAAGDLSINGVVIGAVTGAGTPDDGVDAIVAAINGNADPALANITASNENGVLRLTSSNGQDIIIAGNAPAKAGLVAATTPPTGATFEAGSFQIAGPSGTATIKFPEAGGAAQRASNLVTAINNQSYNTGVSASLVDGKLVLKSDRGDFTIGNGLAAGATQPEIDAANAAVLASTGLTVGTTEGDAVGSAWAEGVPATGFADLDISTAEEADNAILAMDAALNDINAARADLGAIQNRFQSTIASLNTASENLSAARSRIRDTDFAKETAELTRTQILQQAGTAMLAQANQVPQNVLSLLK